MTEIFKIEEAQSIDPETTKSADHFEKRIDHHTATTDEIIRRLRDRRDPEKVAAQEAAKQKKAQQAERIKYIEDRMKYYLAELEVAKRKKDDSRVAELERFIKTIQKI